MIWCGVIEYLIQKIHKIENFPHEVVGLRDECFLKGNDVGVVGAVHDFVEEDPDNPVTTGGHKRHLGKIVMVVNRKM